MAAWRDVETTAAEFAAAVQARFDLRKHKVMATLRRDGSPRLSGIELTFADGEAWFGSMPNSRKAQDLARDPRLAVNCSPEDPPPDPTLWPGDAKLSGRAVVVGDPERLRSMAEGNDTGGILYRIDINEVTLTRVGDPPDFLEVSIWTPERGLRALRAE